MTTPIRTLAPLALGATLLTGCFATQADIRVLQGDLSLIRNEQASADSARKAQIDIVLRNLRAVNDSMAALTNRMTAFRTDLTGSMSSVEQQLIAIQELTGQSQRKLQEVRASLEARQEEQANAAGTASPANGKAGATPTETVPGPNQLFQLGREQLLQGSNSAARSAFEDLLTKYPKADIAADAQFYIAETYAAEGETDAADSVYARVITKYPGSPFAATAYYKRAVAAATAGDSDRARTLFNTLIKKYPKSDEAVLARDRVKALD
jgi:tol-pal system protein YbgF